MKAKFYKHTTNITVEGNEVEIDVKCVNHKIADRITKTIISNTQRDTGVTTRVNMIDLELPEVDNG